jgi:hypothetical protein
LRERINVIQPPFSERVQDPKVFVRVVEELMRLTRTKITHWHGEVGKLANPELGTFPPAQKRQAIKRSLTEMTQAAESLLLRLRAYVALVTPNGYDLDHLDVWDVIASLQSAVSDLLVLLSEVKASDETKKIRESVLRVPTADDHAPTEPATQRMDVAISPAQVPHSVTETSSADVMGTFTPTPEQNERWPGGVEV